MLMKNVRPLGRYGRPMVGPAYTLRFIPAREDLEAPAWRSGEIHREAFEATPARHVLVMDCRSDASAACCGDIMVSRLMVRGGAGLVSDGGIRDSAAIGAMAMPVFVQAPSPPVSRVAHCALEHGRPIACGGVAVIPGDIVMGDADGVIVIPASAAAQVADEALKKDAQDAFVARRILDGAPLKGNFPPDAETLRAFEAYLAAQAKPH
ncbi:ribonuclease activity regulator RraA [Pigmentiphaga soli]|uniref:Ribonuclease activity regulator RraA n=1 Tax=Pigmentiphaga soli TaxID=1007095 RepID=A0ABP8H1Q8_9BURK